MRRDIEVDVESGDVVLKEVAPSTIYPFQWTARPSAFAGNTGLFGEIVVPPSITETEILANGINTFIPYTPSYTDFKVSVRYDYGDVEVRLTHPKTGQQWFDVKCNVMGWGDERNLKASEAIVLSDTSHHLRIDDNTSVAYCFAGGYTDFNIVDANPQNKAMMIQCVPTNNYRYPFTGCNMAQWANCAIKPDEITKLLSEQFSSDGTPIKSASYDTNTNTVYLTLETENAN